MAGEGWFDSLQQAAAIEVFALTAQFKQDHSANKVNLGVGAYRTDEGKPWVLPVVKTAEAHIAADHSLDHEYLPVPGLPDYRSAATKLLLGEDCQAITQNRVDSVQSIGGTGALRVGFDFLKSRLGCDTIYVSQPTWGNHKGIAKSLGYANIKEYRYWSDESRSFDCEGMLEDLRNAPERSVIVLHMCAHNPTGMDPSQEQWEQLARVIREKHLFPFFDCAYQGFSSGDLDKDAYAIRYFAREGFELFGAQSFSKNFGLYNERVGNLVFLTNNAAKLSAIRSQMEIVVRTTWSNSPAHGCRVVATVLNNPALKTEWLDSVRIMANRILEMRKQLFEKLRALGTPGTWDHIVKQSGMFSYTGLNAQQSQHLINKYHIYLLGSGRINMCGLTTKTVDYVASAIDDAVRNVPADPKL